jgi:hypothetical protein
MKKTLRFSILLLLAFAWQHCTDDQAPARPGESNVRFALRAKAITTGRTATSLPEGASLYVSIRRVSGDEVYTLEPVRLLKLGDEYISEPLPLPGGNYALTDFLVADGDGNIVYATPKEGSELASWVDDPLPQAFAVSDDGIAQVDVQVLPTDAQQPEQFGYVTFHVDVVEPPIFQLVVFKPDGNNLVLSRAHVYLVEDDDTVFYQHVPAEVNTIDVALQPNTQYHLMLYEDGFKRYDRYIQLADLTDGPLEVMLEPAFTFVLNNPRTFSLMTMTFDIIEGNEGKSFWIDWGDGLTAGEYTVEYLNTYGLYYQYIDHSPHFVSISSNLDIIRGIRFESVYGGLGAVSVQHLPALELFYVSLGQGTPAVIDFSHNPKLTTLYTEFSSFSSLDVSHNPLLNYILLNGSRQFTTASIDAFIASLYDAVTSQPPGALPAGYVNIAYDTRDNPLPVAQPSDEARAKLRLLANTYGWGIHPQSLLQEP